MLYIGTKKEEEDYRAAPGLSQSFLKKLEGSMSEIHKELDSSKDFIRIGKAVDALLTSKADEFKDNFYVLSSDKSPSDTIVNIITIVYEKLEKAYAQYLLGLDLTSEKEPESFVSWTGGLDEYHLLILGAASSEGYGGKWKEDTVIKKIVEHNDYFRSMIESQGKVVLSKSEFANCENIVLSLQTNPRTKKYFDQQFFDGNPNIDIYYQLPIFFTYKEVECKALLDIVVVEKDDEGKIIKVTPIDLKTTMGDTYYFPKSFRLFKYYIQAFWYTEAAKAHFGVKPERFIFVVESTTNFGKPLDFEVTDETMTMAYQGTKYLPGIEKLMENYSFYQEHGMEMERVIVESKGKPLQISLDGYEPNTENDDW